MADSVSTPPSTVIVAPRPRSGPTDAGLHRIWQSQLIELVTKLHRTHKTVYMPMNPALVDAIFVPWHCTDKDHAEATRLVDVLIAKWAGHKGEVWEIHDSPNSYIPVSGWELPLSRAGEKTTIHVAKAIPKYTTSLGDVWDLISRIQSKLGVRLQLSRAPKGFDGWVIACQPGSMGDLYFATPLGALLYGIIGIIGLEPSDERWADELGATERGQLIA